MARDAVRALQIAGPQAPAETVRRIVRHRDHFFLVAEGRDGDERPEHFFLADAILRLGGHDRGLDIAAFGERRIVRYLAAGQDFRAFLMRDLAIAEHPVSVHERGKRPHFRRGVERIAELE